MQSDVFNESFQGFCTETRADKLANELFECPPFPQHEGLDGYQYWSRYEIERVLAVCPSLLSRLDSLPRKHVLSSRSSQDEVWRVFRHIIKDYNDETGSKISLPEKSQAGTFEAGARRKDFFEDDQKQHSVYPSLALTLKEKRAPGESHFECKSKPMQMDKSCRLHRKFGPDRFITMSVPSLTSSVPERLRSDAKNGALSEAVCRWLSGDLSFFGRKWRVFFVDREERKSKSKSKSGPSGGFKVHLFATAGYDLSEIGFYDFLNWHLNVRMNLKSSDLKLFNRLKLGLSKTMTTFPLEPSEFFHLRDPTNHEVMNDGCARMSMSLAKAIAKHLGLFDIPSAFQGRIAGAKGLWMVVPDSDFPQLGPRGYAIEVSDSQLKVHPHPANNPTADEWQRTFEVSAYSRPAKPSSLNAQLLALLDHGKVPRNVIANLMKQALREAYEQLKISMDSALLLRAWVQSAGFSERSGDIRYTGSFPSSESEQANMLLDAGFSPQDNRILREMLETILKSCLSQCVEDMHISVPLSTSVYCVADPYGVLRPDEIHLGFTESWRASDGEFRETCVENRDVLVFRNPGLLPSDVQKRKTVFRPELRHLKDVVVFPTTGDKPLASLLSGGDYDGDKILVIWDQAIVGPFVNTDLPELPGYAECGLVKRGRPVHEIFGPSNSVSSADRGSRTQTFIRGALTFNLQPSMVGKVTNLHEKLTYRTGEMASENALMIAALAGHQVDCPKQGYEMSSAAFRAVEKKCTASLSKVALPIPAWKNPEVATLQVTHKSNIMDWLKFGVAEPEAAIVLTEFNKKWPIVREIYKHDNALARIWEFFRAEAKKPENIGLRRALDSLVASLDSMKTEWSIRTRPKSDGRPNHEFKQLVEEFQERFRALQPDPSNQHKYTDLWALEAQGPLGTWSLLRASYLHKASHSSSRMVWYIAAEELCFMKAQACSTRFRSVVTPVYGVLKFDSKLVKRSQAMTDGANSDDEFFYCDVENEADGMD